MPKRKKSLSIGFLFDDTLDSNDGVAQYVKTLGAWLTKYGHEVTYLVGQSKQQRWAGGAVKSLARNVPVTFNKNRLTIPLPAKKAVIKETLDNNFFDIVHVQVPYSPLMAQKVIGMLPDRTALIGTFHILPSNRHVELGAKLLRQFLRQSLPRFDSFLSVSQPAAEFAQRVLKINASVIPNMVDISRFSIQLKKRKGVPVIVFLGRLVPRKGSMELLAAFKLLANIRNDVNLVIAGDGPLKPKLIQYCRRQQLDNRVTFLGFIDENDKPELLAGADIACFPSLGGESFGIVLIEAMAAGSGVVVGGDNPGYRSVLQDDRVLIRPKNSHDFADKLNGILENKQRAKEIHQLQQSQVKQYGVENVGRLIEAAYRQAIVKRSNNRHN